MHTWMATRDICLTNVLCQVDFAYYLSVILNSIQVEDHFECERNDTILTLVRVCDL